MQCKITCLRETYVQVHEKLSIERMCMNRKDTVKNNYSAKNKRSVLYRQIKL